MHDGFGSVGRLASANTIFLQGCRRKCSGAGVHHTCDPKCGRTKGLGVRNIKTLTEILLKRVLISSGYLEGVQFESIIYYKVDNLVTSNFSLEVWL